MIKKENLEVVEVHATSYYNISPADEGAASQVEQRAPGGRSMAANKKEVSLQDAPHPFALKQKHTLCCERAAAVIVGRVALVVGLTWRTW
jgi:hypothetical protein